MIKIPKLFAEIFGCTVFDRVGSSLISSAEDSHCLRSSFCTRSCLRLVESCFYRLRNISKIESILSFKDSETLLLPLISWRPSYCNSLFTCLQQKWSHRLQNVEISAARPLTRTKKRWHITPDTGLQYVLEFILRSLLKLFKALTFRTIWART